MKKIFALVLTTLPLVFLSCSSNKTSSEETSGLNEYSLDYDAFKNSYGEAKLTMNGEAISSDNGTYYINVQENKITYELSGYFTGRIIVQNANNLSSFKGILLYLNNAFIVNDNEATIDYSLSSKTFELISKTNTTNYVVNKSATNYDGHSINAMNNLSIGLEEGSTLNVYSTHGHTVKADGFVKIGGKGNITLSSGHDGIHCHNFATNYGEEFSGKFTINNAISQGIEASKASCEGTLTINGGEFTINNAESVFKVDVTINISGGSLNGTGIWATPFVRGGDSQLSLIVADGVSVVVDGKSFGSQTF